MEFNYDSLIAMESGLEFVLDEAMEGVNADAFKARKATMKEVRAMASEMKAAAKAGDYKTAAEKARDCASKFDELKRLVNDMDQSTSSAVLIDLGLALAAIVAIAATAFGLAKAGKAIGRSKGLKGAAAKYDANVAAKGATRGRGNAAGTKAFNESVRKSAIDYDNSNRKQLMEALKTTKDPKQRAKIQDMLREYNKKDSMGIKKAFADEVKAGGKAGSLTSLARQSADAAKDTAAANANAQVHARMLKMGADAGARAGKKAGALAGGGIASTAIGAFLAKKGFLGAKKSGEKLQPNDVNALLNHYRKTCDDGKRRYTELAKMYDEMAAAE